MKEMEAVLMQLNELQCPAGEVEQRVEKIVAASGLSTKQEIQVSRNRQFDRDGATAYCVNLPGQATKEIIVLTAIGMDGYVEKVVQAYASS